MFLLFLSCLIVKVLNLFIGRFKCLIGWFLIMLFNMLIV